MSTQPKHYLTPEEYLEIERKAEFRSEYFAGEMFAMAGARAPHNLINANLVIRLGSQLHARPCFVYSNEQRVLVSPAGLYTYPDVVVVCGEPQFVDREFDTLINPTLLVEVLSPSTEAYDRGRKFSLYRGIESLKGYLMVSSELIAAELFTRQAERRWTLTSEGKTPEDIIELEPIECRLKLADVYEKVQFSERGPEMRPL